MSLNISLKERATHRQMAINMLSGICVFVLNLCVAFFLTPFIVSKLGMAAYGFIGLSNNLISYTAILTIAINSMSGRFVTVKVHEGNLSDANGYMSSIFYANLLMSGIILIGVIIASVYLQYLIDIPENLVSDVKALFLMLGISSCIGLMTGVISVGAFIRNRLDVTNVRNMAGSFLRVVLLLLLFGLLPAKLWYVGITMVIMNLYTLSANYYFYRVLTPELQIKFEFFDLKKLMEVISAGAWNILTRISDILSRGVDLLLANLFISASAMGLLSIVLTIPMLILSFFSIISGNYAPEFTRLYAIGDFEALKKALLQSVRLTGLLCCIPSSIIFAYGDIIYNVWMPGEDSGLLYMLTCLCSIGMVFGLPQEPLWNIFTITNKLRKSSLNLFYNSIMIFVTVMVAMFVIDDNMNRLIALALIRNIYGTIRVTTFLPIYGATCLGYDRWTFYPPIIRNVVNVAIVTSISLMVKHAFLSSGWMSLFAGVVFTASIGFVISFFTVLKGSDREFVVNYLKAKLKL